MSIWRAAHGGALTWPPSPRGSRVWLWFFHSFYIASGVVPGPLLRATVWGSPGKLTHMPLKPGSSYAHVPKALLQAYDLNKKNGIVDPEEDLAGAEAPHYGNHGNRRHSDKVRPRHNGADGCH